MSDPSKDPAKPAGKETPRRRATALAYDPLGGDAPRVVAKGEGELAERIIAKAREHGLPVHEDPALVGFLMRVDLDESIPPALYLAVANVLALIWRVEAQAGSAGRVDPLRRF
jgi:flagellar biosynthesis protein